MKVFGTLVIVFAILVTMGNGCGTSDGVLNVNSVSDTIISTGGDEIIAPPIKETEIDLSKVTLERVYGYQMLLTSPLIADDDENPQISTLRLFENGVELGPAHSIHDDIRDMGKGRFSHWRGRLYFSASDNTDPRSNGRKYTYRVDDAVTAAPFKAHASLPTLTAGEQTQIIANGGVAPYTYAVASGGGSITDYGVYTAPNASARPVIHVTDALQRTITVQLRSMVLHFLGGNENGSQTNVWSSHDGATWVAQKPLPVAIQGMSLGVVNDVLLMIGGYTAAASGMSYKTTALDQTTSWQTGSALPGGATGEMAGRLVHNGKMYIAAREKFFSTTDGVNFTTVATLPWVPDRFGGVRLTHFNGKFLIIAGANWSTSQTSRSIWASSDGVQWAFQSYLPVERYAPALFNFNGKLYLAGGLAQSNVTSNQVYSSSDGLNWNLIGTLPAPRDHIHGVVYKGKMYIIGGSENGVGKTTVWSSTDGITWNTVGNLPAARNNGDVVVY